MPLVGVRWVDSSAGMVAVLQAVEPMTGFAGAVLVLIAAATRRWRTGTIIRSRSRVTLVEFRRDDPRPRAFNQPVVLMYRQGGDVMLRAVHSRPPSLLAAADWRSGLADLQAW